MTYSYSFIQYSIVKHSVQGWQLMHYEFTIYSASFQAENFILPWYCALSLWVGLLAPFATPFILHYMHFAQHSKQYHFTTPTLVTGVIRVFLAQHSTM